MDSTAFFTIVTFLSVLILLAIGAYLILLIHEAHQSLKKVNKILARFEGLTSFLEGSIARPTLGLASLAGLVHDGTTLLKDLRTLINNKQEKDPDNG